MTPNTTTTLRERAMSDSSRAAYKGIQVDFNVFGPFRDVAKWMYRYSAANAAARKLVAERTATKIERTNDV